MLNDAKIKAAKPKDKPYKLGDANQLYLLVQTSGARLWRMNYSHRETPTGPLKQKTLALGAYPAVTLLDARKQRDEAKELLRHPRIGKYEYFGLAQQVRDERDAFAIGWADRGAGL